MKYGIQYVKDGETYYASSTRSRNCYTKKITDIALFVQEKSAVDALKELRRDGAEADGGNLQVVEINFVVNSVIEVERPKTQTGFSLMIDGADEHRKYFYGTKNGKGRESQWSDPNIFGNKERATVFATEKQAADRQAMLVMTAENYRDYNQKQGPRYGYRNADEAEKYFVQEMDRHGAAIASMKNLKIVAHTK